MNRFFRPIVFVYSVLICSLILNVNHYVKEKYYKEIEGAYIELTDILGIDFSGKRALNQKDQKIEIFMMVKVSQWIENGELSISLDVQ